MKYLTNDNGAIMKKMIEEYFNYFNSGNREGMISLLDENIEHDINQGKTQVGLKVFREFMNHMDNCYKENLTDIVVMPSECGKFCAAEFVVNGTYLKTDGTLPPAKGQTYVLRAGSFFEIKNNKIKRVTTYYNLPLWIEMVSK